ncbi:hypothetical protein HPB48_015533 [Haemaphysalis longicornis]|uniref:LRRK2 beta-propeller domain-containing protein n=1 Tax=Haemaphysalis longicornis TaxID=44386 RepID=A0A9J6FJM3_HAELO|nr:hypothetical protein HPB48_015533 [Haemaphysalis longicornis]
MAANWAKRALAEKVGTLPFMFGAYVTTAWTLLRVRNIAARRLDARLLFQIEARVICMHALGSDVMLLGTLSHFVHAYSTRTRELKWEAQLNDSVLSLCSYEEDDQCQVFAGLADGTMAVIENFSLHVDKPDTLYIHIGSSPVTCLKLVDKRLWCATGNRIVILSARTLDTVDQFQVSPSSLDYISLLQPCSADDGAAEHCVWLALRGSSVLQLWDAQALTCKMLYDVRDDRYPRSPQGQLPTQTYTREL